MIHLDREDLIVPRQRRFYRACDTLGVDQWLLTTGRAIRFVAGAVSDGIDPAGEYAHPMVAVGEKVYPDAVSRDDPALIDFCISELPHEGRLAVDMLGAAALAALREARPGLEIVDMSDVLATARGASLTPAELQAIREGQARTELAVENALRNISAGMTERDVSEAILMEGERLGLTEPLIDPAASVIPLSRTEPFYNDGPFAPIPLAAKDDRELKAGDQVAIDVGFHWHGYHTDVGWTFLVDREATRHESSLSAEWVRVMERIENAVVPGATAADLRLAALDGWEGHDVPWPSHIWLAHGLAFMHSEPPFAGTDFGIEHEKTVGIPPNSILVLEPYIWRGDVGGYRAEMMLQVTEDGADRVSALDMAVFPTAGL